MSREIRTRILRGVLATVVCSALCLPAVALADDGETNSAESHAEQGKAYYRVQVWDKAVEEFEKSLALDPLPETMFNIGRCYEKLNKLDKAVQYYQRFLNATPEGADGVVETRARIEILRRQLASTQAERTKRRTEELRRKQATTHHTNATAFINSKQYDEAIAEYTKAHKLGGDAEFIFYIAEAYRAKGDKARAVVEYDRYREKAPAGKNAAQALKLKHILEVELRREIEKKSHSKSTQGEKLDREMALDDGRQPAKRRAVVAPVTPGKDTSTNSGRTLKLAGIATAGVGAVTIGVGVFFGLRAGSLASDVEDAQVWTPELDQKFADGESAATNATIMFAVGGAAIIGGGVLYYLGHRRDAQQRRDLAVAPTAGPSSAGVLIRGTF